MEEEESQKEKAVSVGHIDRHCDLCGKLSHCHVIETAKGALIVCPACKKKKYKGVE